MTVVLYGATGYTGRLVVDELVRRDADLVLVNCAGPFTRAGEPVVRAAVEAGVRHVDSTGEQGFIRTVLERFDVRIEAPVG